MEKKSKMIIAGALAVVALVAGAAVFVDHQQDAQQQERIDDLRDALG